MLVALLVTAVVVYIVSFALVMKVPQGTTGVASVGAPPPPLPPMIIYASRSTAMNGIAKVVYYPLVRAGEGMGCWRFADDVRNARAGAPCLLWFLVYQLWVCLTS